MCFRGIDLASDFTMNRFDFWNCSNSGILFFYILLYVYIYQVISMVAVVSCVCIGATVHAINAAVRFVNTIILIRLNLPLRISLYNKSLSIKGSLIFRLMNSSYNFNLYIKSNCSLRPHFQVTSSGLYIQV